MSKMEDLKVKLEKLVGDHPEIRDTTHIGFHIPSKGFTFWKKDSIKILGRVNRQEELEIINEIMKKECQGIEVINQLRVENRA